MNVRPPPLSLAPLSGGCTLLWSRMSSSGPSRLSKASRVKAKPRPPKWSPRSPKQMALCSLSLPKRMALSSQRPRKRTALHKPRPRKRKPRPRPDPRPPVDQLVDHPRPRGAADLLADLRRPKGSANLLDARPSLRRHRSLQRIPLQHPRNRPKARHPNRNGCATIRPGMPKPTRTHAQVLAARTRTPSYTRERAPTQAHARPPTPLYFLLLRAAATTSLWSLPLCRTPGSPIPDRQRALLWKQQVFVCSLVDFRSPEYLLGLVPRISSQATASRLFHGDLKYAASELGPTLPNPLASVPDWKSKMLVRACVPPMSVCVCGGGVQQSRCVCVCVCVCARRILQEVWSILVHCNCADKNGDCQGVCIGPVCTAMGYCCTRTPEGKGLRAACSTRGGLEFAPRATFAFTTTKVIWLMENGAHIPGLHRFCPPAHGFR